MKFFSSSSYVKAFMIQGFADLDQNPKENGELADFSLFFSVQERKIQLFPWYKKKWQKKHQILISHVKYSILCYIPNTK